VIARVGTEWFLFGGAGLLSLLAFAALILAPAIGSFSRGWEKVAVTLLSVVVLVVLLALGVALGVLIVYYWDDITALFS
jgi:sterol desaturase/sphingolipid hydroxylase (fatty acid hydroxylase superfamily)